MNFVKSLNCHYDERFMVTDNGPNSGYSYSSNEAGLNDCILQQQKTDNSIPDAVFLDGYFNIKMPVCKDAIDLSFHRRSSEKTIFEDAEFFARNYPYKLLPITLEIVNETIIHIEHNYCNSGSSHVSEPDEDCRVTDYGEWNYRRRKSALLSEGNSPEMEIEKVESVSSDIKSEDAIPNPDDSSTSIQPLDLSYPFLHELKTESNTLKENQPNIPKPKPETRITSELKQYDALESNKENVTDSPRKIQVTISRPGQKEYYQPCEEFLNDVAKISPDLIRNDCYEIDIIDRTDMESIQSVKNRTYYIVSETAWHMFENSTERIILTNDLNIGKPVQNAEKVIKPTYMIFDQNSLTDSLAKICETKGGRFEYTCLEETKDLISRERDMGCDKRGDRGEEVGSLQGDHVKDSSEENMEIDVHCDGGEVSRVSQENVYESQSAEVPKCIEAESRVCGKIGDESISEDNNGMYSKLNKSEENKEIIDDGAVVLRKRPRLTNNQVRKDAIKSEESEQKNELPGDNIKSQDAENSVIKTVSQVSVESERESAITRIQIPDDPIKSQESENSVIKTTNHICKDIIMSVESEQSVMLTNSQVHKDAIKSGESDQKDVIAGNEVPERRESEQSVMNQINEDTNKDLVTEQRIIMANNQIPEDTNKNPESESGAKLVNQTHEGAINRGENDQRDIVERNQVPEFNNENLESEHRDMLCQGQVHNDTNDSQVPEEIRSDESEHRTAVTSSEDNTDEDDQMSMTAKNKVPETNKNEESENRTRNQNDEGDIKCEEGSQKGVIARNQVPEENSKNVESEHRIALNESDVQEDRNERGESECRLTKSEVNIEDEEGNPKCVIVKNEVSENQEAEENITITSNQVNEPSNKRRESEEEGGITRNQVNNDTNKSEQKTTTTRNRVRKDSVKGEESERSSRITRNQVHDIINKREKSEERIMITRNRVRKGSVKESEQRVIKTKSQVQDTNKSEESEQRITRSKKLVITDEKKVTKNEVVLKGKRKLPPGESPKPKTQRQDPRDSAADAVSARVIQTRSKTNFNKTRLRSRAKKNAP